MQICKLWGESEGSIRWIYTGYHIKGNCRCSYHTDLITAVYRYGCDHCVKRWCNIYRLCHCTERDSPQWKTGYGRSLLVRRVFGYLECLEWRDDEEATYSNNDSRIVKTNIVTNDSFQTSQILMICIINSYWPVVANRESDRFQIRHLVPTKLLST